MRALGWAILEEVPDRGVVLGSITQPWLADVVFHGLPPDEFVRFHEPGFVKIAVALWVEPLGDDESIFRTETRVMATDPAARSKFRWYWSFLSPGILLIRWVSLSLVKKEAEDLARSGRT